MAGVMYVSARMGAISFCCARTLAGDTHTAHPAGEGMLSRVSIWRLPYENA